LSIRVRKLAKELDHSPAEVVGLLHALGHTRYRTTEDQVPDALLPQLRSALRRGVKPVPVRVEERATEVVPPPAQHDLMAALVPGVIPVGAPRGPGSRAAAPAMPASTGPSGGVARAAAPVVSSASVAVGGAGEDVRARAAEREALRHERAALDAERAAFDAERQAIDAERNILVAERRALTDDRLQLVDDRARVAVDRTAIAAERAAAAARRETALGTSLVELLVRRGLVGPDEQERALASLATTRHLRSILPALRTTDPESVERLLADRVVLSAEPTTLPGAAVLVVDADRAELPPAETLGRELSAVSEQLMLQGLRRVTVVGGPARWHKLLREGIDDRVELRFRAAGVRGRADAEADVTRTDVVVLWATPVQEDGRAVYATSRAIVVEVPQADVGALVRCLRQHLDGV
jgi:hypothetical protein